MDCSSTNSIRQRLGLETYASYRRKRILSNLSHLTEEYMEEDFRLSSELLRNTGRSTEMLLRALKRLEAGARVVLIAYKKEYAEKLRIQLHEFAVTLGIDDTKVTTQGVKGPYIDRLEPGEYVILRDHYDPLGKDSE